MTQKFPQEAAVILRQAFAQDVMILADRAVRESTPKIDRSLIIEKGLNPDQVSMLSMYKEGWEDCWEYFRSLAEDVKNTRPISPYLSSDESPEQTKKK